MSIKWLNKEKWPLGVFFINFSHDRKIAAPEKNTIFLTHRLIMRFCSWPEMAWDFFSRWKLLQFDCTTQDQEGRGQRSSELLHTN